MESSAFYNPSCHFLLHSTESYIQLYVTLSYDSSAIKKKSLNVLYMCLLISFNDLDKLPITNKRQNKFYR